MKVKRLQYLASLAIICLLFPGGGAAAPNSEQRAKRLFREGNVLYERGDYPGALKLFQRAHRSWHNRRILLNIALTQEKLHDLPGAARNYERFLLQSDRRKHPRRREAVRQKLRRLQRQLGRVRLVCGQAGALVEVDGKISGLTPLPYQIYLTPGPHRFVVSKKGFEVARRTAALRPAQQLELKLKLTPVGPASRSAAPSSRPLAGARGVEPAEVEASSPSSSAARPPVYTSGLFFHALVGPSWSTFGDPQLEAGVTAEVGLRLGWQWRWRSLALHADASLFALPGSEETGKGEDRFWFLSTYAGGGVRYYLLRSLWVGARLSAGLATLVGVDGDVSLFDPGMTVTGPVSLFALRPEVTIGLTIWSGLTFVLTPLAVDYSPRHRAFHEQVDHIVRYHVGVAAGWQL